MKNILLATIAAAAPLLAQTVTPSPVQVESQLTEVVEPPSASKPVYNRARATSAEAKYVPDGKKSLASRLRDIEVSVLLQDYEKSLAELATRNRERAMLKLGDNDSQRRREELDREVDTLTRWVNGLKEQLVQHSREEEATAATWQGALKLAPAAPRTVSEPTLIAPAPASSYKIPPRSGARVGWPRPAPAAADPAHGHGYDAPDPNNAIPPPAPGVTPSPVPPARAAVPALPPPPLAPGVLPLTPAPTPLPAPAAEVPPPAPARPDLRPVTPPPPVRVPATPPSTSEPSPERR
jgi:hypothetical protein